MKKTILTLIVISISRLCAQNLVVNPGAEGLPAGTGWTIINSGAVTCLSFPTNNMLNWTLKPDGTSNYPYDHTTGTPGGTIFFPGCDTYLTGPFELQQTIDISANASNIDAGNQVYAFIGYMQTPVSPQSDEGRYVVQFLNAAGAVLTTGYSSNWQSNSGGSGTGWVKYVATPTAPAGARKALIRLQAKLYFNRPAINVYFDDISFTPVLIVPLGLVSFSAKEAPGAIHLSWTMSDEQDCRQFEVERSTDAVHYDPVASIAAAGKLQYDCIDPGAGTEPGKYFYRLKFTNAYGKAQYSKVVVVHTGNTLSISLSPNPASNRLTVSGLPGPGIVSLIDYRGSTEHAIAVNSASVSMDLGHLPAGPYIVRYRYNTTSVYKKLLIVH